MIIVLNVGVPETTFKCQDKMLNLISLQYSNLIKSVRQMPHCLFSDACVIISHWMNNKLLMACTIWQLYQLLNH